MNQVVNSETVKRSNEVELKERLRELAKAIKRADKVSEARVEGLDDLNAPYDPNDNIAVLKLEEIRTYADDGQPLTSLLPSGSSAAAVASVCIKMPVIVRTRHEGADRTMHSAYSEALSSIDPQNPSSLYAQAVQKCDVLEYAKLTVLKGMGMEGHGVELLVKLRV